MVEFWNCRGPAKSVRACRHRVTKWIECRVGLRKQWSNERNVVGTTPRSSERLNNSIRSSANAFVNRVGALPYVTHKSVHIDIKIMTINYEKSNKTTSQVHNRGTEPYCILTVVYTVQVYKPETNNRGLFINRNWNRQEKITENIRKPVPTSNTDTDPALAYTGCNE